MIPAPRKILLIKLRGIGDAVLATPCLEALHQAWPQARLTLMVSAPAASLFRVDPRVAEVIPYQAAWFRGLRHHAAVFAGLQRRGFDLALCLHASFRTALLGWMSGAPWRSVRNHSGHDWFCNLPAAEPKEPKSVIQRDFDALRALGLRPEGEATRLYLEPWAKAEAAQKWRALRLPQKGVVLLSPTASKPERRWPMPRWQALARALQAAKKKPLWLAPYEPLELPADLARGAAILGPCPLPVQAACLAKASAVVANDSGPSHLAAACKVPTFTLFGGPETLREWQPYGAPHQALQAPSLRINDLAAEQVIPAVLAWLKPQR
jgi:ADP-heptose:LPS heptosyltransferase